VSSATQAPRRGLPSAQLDWKLRERGVQYRHVVGGGVRAGVAGPQETGEMLSRFVEEAVERVEAEAALAVRAGALLAGVTLEQLRVEIERDPRRPHAQPPGALTRPPTRLADRGELRLPERREKSCRGRVRRDRTEQRRLLREHAQIGDTVAAVDQRRREINQHPARIMLRPPTKQPRERRRQLPLQPQPGGQLRHQRRTRPRNQTGTISRDLKRSEPAAMLHHQGASSSRGMWDSTTASSPRRRTFPCPATPQLMRNRG
jgi:hypothetical protein